MRSDSGSDTQQNLLTAIDKLTRGAYEDSIAICRNLINAEPENHQLTAKAHLVMGRAYLMLKQFEISEQELKMGLQLDASQAQGYVDLGLTHLQRKHYAEAFSYLRRAQEYSNMPANTRLILAIAWLQAGQFEDAYSELERLLSSRDHNLPRGGLHILRVLAWYGKISWRYQLLIVPLVVGLMLPLTRLWMWILMSILALGALLVLYRSRLLREGGRPIVYLYALLTGLFLLSLVMFR